MKQATIAVVLAGVLAGLTGIFVKWMPTMTATSIAGLRMFLPFAFIGIYLKSRKVKIFRKNTSRMLIASAINAIRLYFFFVAYIFTSVAAAAILFYAFPIFVAIMGHYFLKERMSKAQWVFLILAFTGMIISFSHQPVSFENRDFLGMGAAVLAGLGYAVTVILFKTQADEYGSTEMVFFQNFVGAIVYLPFFLLASPSIALPDIGYCLLYTFMIGFLVFKLFFTGLKYLDASITSSIMYLEVVSAIIFSFFLLGERLSPNMILGGIIIIASSFMINYSSKSNSTRSSGGLDK